jgi:hypothetical protein
MTINIKNFKVIDLTSGKMEQSGRKTQTQLNVIKSQDKFKTSLVEQQAVPYEYKIYTYFERKW